MVARLTLVGVGRWGKNYLRTIGGMKNCRLVAVRTHDFDEIPKLKSVDGVIIATPAETHFAIAKFFLEKGYPILVEKPVTTSLTQAKELLAISKRVRKPVLVGHIYLYHPAFEKMLKILPKIGKLRSIESIGCQIGPFRDDVSALWDWGPHDVAMCLSVVKQMPLSIDASPLDKDTKDPTNADMILLKMTFPSGVVSHTIIGRKSPVKKRRMKLVGEKGTLVFDDTRKNKFQETPLEREINDFISAIHGRKPRSDISLGVRVTRILAAAQRSLKKGRPEAL